LGQEIANQGQNVVLSTLGANWWRGGGVEDNLRQGRGERNPVKKPITKDREQRLKVLATNTEKIRNGVSGMHRN